MPIEQDVLADINDIPTPIADTETDNNNDTAVLRDCVRSVLTSYIKDLEGHSVDDLYQLVLAEVEAPAGNRIRSHLWQPE